MADEIDQIKRELGQRKGMAHSAQALQQQILELRQQGLTQQEIGSELGLSRSAVSRIVGSSGSP